MRALLAVVAALLIAGCAAKAPEPTAPAKLRAHVLDEIPHDTSAFTEGLEIADGILYEGTGLEGKSDLRATDPDTGRVSRKTPLPREMFGEGITVVGDVIWQLTWQDGVAVKRDRGTFREVGRATYDGEGWGLCHDDDRLVMSNGTARLTFRDPDTFDETGRVEVTDADGAPVPQLNELECVGGAVYANVWKTDRIVRIDPRDGKVTATVDLAGLLPAADRAEADVLNGIAAIPETDEFLVTGKLWPTMFRVKFVTEGA